MTSKARQSTVDSPQETTTDVVTYTDMSDESLRALTSFDEALALATDVHGGVEVAADVLGNGFAILKDENKYRLVGVPLLFLDWRFNQGDMGEFVSAYVVARNEDGTIAKYVLNDGSSGICKTLRTYTDNTGRSGGLAARHGLRFSDYIYCSECNAVVDPVEDHEHAKAHKKAATFYIETSA